MPISVLPIALTPRHVTLRLSEPGARFSLAAARSWRLRGDRGDRTGTAGRVIMSLSDLHPDTDYLFEADGCAPLAFRTPACAGLINAADHARPGQDETAALQAAIVAVPEGGTLLMPAGDWISGPLFLKSHMTLHFKAGARLKAIGDRDRIPILDAHRDGRVLGSWEGEPAACYAAILTAIGCKGLAITGPGNIDGGGDRGDWWTWPKETRQGARRARTLHLIGCEDIILAGLTICNSPSWTLHPFQCRRLTAADLTITNPPDSPNTDGLDPESCEDVVITGVHFSVGDDCIAIKAGKRGPGDNRHLAPTRLVTVSHCLMERGHGGVVLGSEMSGGIEDVTVEDCDMRGTDRGLRIKTRRGRGGFVRRIAVRGVAMDGVETAIAVNSFYFCDADGHADWVQSRAPAPVDDTTPIIEDIVIEDLALRNIRLAVGVLLGLPESPLRNVRIGRLSAHFDPAATPGIPEMADHVRPFLAEGLVAENAECVVAAGSDLTVDHGVSVSC